MKYPKALALILVSCVGWQANPSHHYHLVIASTFSSSQSAAIWDAADEWQNASGEYVTFDGATASDDVITFYADTTEELKAEFGGSAGVTLYEGQSSRVELNTSLDAQTFHQTVLHEIGHALGLVHTTPGNIMCKDTVCATLEVTCGDLDQLLGHSITGCFP